MRWCRSSASRARSCAAAALGLAALLPACIVVPVPERASSELGRAELEGELDRFVRPGDAIADLMLRLGEPDATSLDGGQIAYRWQRIWAYFFAIVPVGAGPAPAPAMLPIAGALETEWAVVIDIAAGRVARTRVAQSSGRLLDAATPDHVRPWGTLTLFEAQTFLGEPVEAAARATWLGSGHAAPVEALLVVTPDGVHLKAPGSFGPAPADLRFPYAEIASARLESATFGTERWLVIETKRGAEHRFELQRHNAPGIAERVQRRIRAHLMAAPGG